MDEEYIMLKWLSLDSFDIGVSFMCIVSAIPTIRPGKLLIKVEPHGKLYLEFSYGR